MLRAAFVHGVAAATSIATGGLDVWDPASPQIRVLVAADAGGEVPMVYPDGTFLYAGRRWRGAPSTIGLPDGHVALVTTIDADLYLQGVLPLEMPASWPAAALQAQAIVARTFALGRRTISRAYDVRADDRDQHWGGVDAELAGTSAAVVATRGRTIAYAGAPAAVFYSACCGGRTADAAEVWGGPPQPYLRGVVDPYCVPAPDYRWIREVALERVTAAFGARTGGPPTGVALSDPDAGGRPRTVVLRGAASAAIPIAEFRRVLGFDVIRSLWLRALRIEGAQAGARLVIEGSGRGHGVGLCQWGTRFLALSGASVTDILSFYFPGTSLSGG